MSYIASFKVCVFGECGVGKTSLTHRYIINRFLNDAKRTIGVDIFPHDIEIDNNRVMLQIWDFGGEERFRSFLPVYARGSSGGIFMYDITKRSSLDNFTEWLSIFNINITEGKGQIPILGVGGKKDLEDRRKITLKTAKNLVIKHDIYEIIECSAKSGENIEKIFESITRKMLTKYGLI